MIISIHERQVLIKRLKQDENIMFKSLINYTAEIIKEGQFKNFDLCCCFSYEKVRLLKILLYLHNKEKHPASNYDFITYWFTLKALIEIKFLIYCLEKNINNKLFNEDIYNIYIHK